MEQAGGNPQIFRVLRQEALEIKNTPYGSVGKLFNGQGIEAIWVRKENEEIDKDWFSQPQVDLIFVVQGKLKVEFERSDLLPQVLEPGDFLILPANTRCRAYSWPRDAQKATVFIAVYPST